MKKTLVLVPGLLCDDWIWSFQIEALADVANVHVANHGEVDSLGALAEALIARAPPRFAIAGHSMGGRVALEVARRVPERLIGFAILDSGYEAVAPGEAGEREAAGRRSMLALAKRSGMRAMARNWLQGMVHAPRLTDSELIEPIVDMFDRHTPELYALQIQALLHRPDAKSVFAGIHCPSLVLCGRDDLWAPPSRHETMAKMLRHSTFGSIPHCGHMSPLERPRAVNEAFRSWIAAMEDP
ncbi:MAG: alpha/beta hydrolase [Proteobacteria bacterium]|nr:alpha/beta hydrolase [Pseudomonadota bacterium]